MTTQLHPYVVHFPVALLLVSVVLFYAGTLGGSQPWAAGVLTAARWNLWIGAPLALVAIGAGFVDYIAAQCDAETIAATMLHRRYGAVTSFSFNATEMAEAMSSWTAKTSDISRS